MAELLNAENFKEKVFDYEKNKEWVFDKELPCIVDFYADWCGPCKMLAPVFQELSEEYKGKINFYKLDTEAEQEIAAMFGVRSIPTIMFCVPGESQPQIANGAYPKNQLEEIIAQVFGIEK